MKVLEGVLKVLPSVVILEVDGKEYKLPVVYKNGQFVPFTHSGAVKEVYAYPGGYAGIEGDMVLYFPKLEDNLQVFVKITQVQNGISRKLQDKKELKAYETPQKTVELFVEIWLKKLKGSIEEVLHSRGPAALLMEVEGVPLDRFYRYMRDNWEKLSPALKGVLDVPPRFVVFDPQAGSGDALLKACEKYGIDDPILRGVELREVQNTHPGYKVQTGVDYLAYYSVLYEELSAKRGDRIEFSPDYKRPEWAVKIAQEHGISLAELLRSYSVVPRFLNPPYVDQGRHPVVSTTFGNEPPVMRDSQGNYSGGWGFVVASNAHKNVLDRYYNYLSRKIASYDEVGYEYAVPESYLLGIVVNNTHYSVESDVRDPFKYLRQLNLVTKNLPAVEEFVKVASDRAKNIMSRFENITVEELLSPLSFAQAARKGARVFPALDMIGGEGVGFYAYDEVINNPMLLELYRAKAPHIFRLVEEMAKERGDELLVSEVPEHRIMPEEGLGILKYAGFSSVYPLNDELKGKLINLLPEGEKEKFEYLVSELEKEERLEIWLKTGDGALSFEDGTVGFGRQTQVCLCNAMGKVYAILPVDPVRFLSEVNTVNIKTYAQKEDFPEVAINIIKEYVKHAGEGIRHILSEEEIGEIDGFTVQTLGKEFAEVCDSIYVEQKLEGRFIKDRILKDEFFDILTSVVHSRLRGMGEDAGVIKRVLSLIEHMRRAYEDNFVYFLYNLDEVMDEDFARKYTEGKPVLEWLRDRLDGLQFGEDAKIEIYSFLVEELFVYKKKVLEEDPMILRKAALQYVVSKELKELLERGEYNLAYRLFREHLRKHLGLLDYQIEFAFNSSYAMFKENKNVVLGWQQRTGKTRAALVSLLFQYLLRGKTSNFFVRSQNVMDILGQAIETMPVFAPFMRVTAGQTRTADLNSEFLATTPYPDHTYPNPFYRASGLFVRKGTAIEELLKQNAYAKIEHYIENPDPDLLAYARGRIYEAVLDAPGYIKRALEGLVCYLAELDLRGELDVKNTKAWQNWLDTVFKDGELIEQDRRELSQRKTAINLIAREVGYPAINALTEMSKKFLDKGVTVNVDVDLKEAGSYFSEYYVVPPKLIVNMGERFEEFRDKVIYAGMVAGKEVYIVHEKETAPFLDYIRENELDRIRNYELMNFSTFYNHLMYVKMQPRSSSRAPLEDRGFPIRDNLSCYLEIPEVVPVVKIDKKDKNNITLKLLIPDDTSGFEKTIIKFDRNRFLLDYRYDVEKNGKRIFRSSTTNARSFMISMKAFEGSASAHDEAEGRLKEQGISQSQLVIKAFASQGNGAVIQISGTAGPEDRLVTKEPIDVTLSNMRIIQNLTEMREVKDERYRGFFEYLVAFLSYLSRYGKKEAMEETILTLADKNLSFEDRVRALKNLYEQHDFFEPHMEEAFETVINLVEKLDKKGSEEELIAPAAKKIYYFLNHLSKEVSDMEGWSYNTLLNAVQNSLDYAGLTRKREGRDPVLLANLGMAEGKDTTFGNVYSFTGQRGTELLVKDRRELSEMLRNYKNYKVWNYREKPVGSLGIIEADPKVLAFLWGNNIPKTIREAYDLIDRNTFIYRDLYDDLIRIAGAFQEQFEGKKMEEVFKSSKTTQDSFVELLSSYVRDRELRTKNEKKKEFLEDFLKSLVEAKIEKEVIKQEDEDKKEAIYHITIDFRGEKWTVSINERELNYKPSIEKFVEVINQDWNILIDLAAGRGWEPALFRNKLTTMPFKFNPIFGDFEPVVDSISNGALVKEYARTVEEGKNVFITSDRVPSLMVALGDLLNTVYANRGDRKVSVLVLVTDTRIKEFLDRVDRDFLARNGIYLEEAYSASELTVKAQKLVAQNRQVYVVANTVAVARGTDLSMLDEIILAGRVAGNEGLQVLERLSNPLKRSEKFVYLGVAGDFKKIRIGDAEKAIPSHTLRINVGTLGRRNMEILKHTGEVPWNVQGVIVSISGEAEKLLSEMERQVQEKGRSVQKAVAV